MKKIIISIFFIALLSLVFAACSEVPETAHVSGNIKVQIPQLQIDGTYRLQATELRELKSLYELSGRFAQFYYRPQLSKQGLSGLAPKAHFIKSSDGTYVPSDDLSLQLASLYYHTQKLAEFDQSLGVYDVNSWPRKVGVAVGIKEGAQRLQNNSFYDGEADAILFVPYSDTAFPLTANGGIIAHEHFHSLFYKLVFLPLLKEGKLPARVNTTIHNQKYFRDKIGLANKVNQDSQKEEVKSEVELDQEAEKILHDSYQTLYFKALNEGLADYWGWIYTSDANYITLSLPKEKGSRSLHLPDWEKEQPMLSKISALKSEIQVYLTDGDKVDSRINSAAYRLGTQYSRFLKAYTDVYARERVLNLEVAKNQVAKIILVVMYQLRQKVLMQENRFELTPADFIQSVMDQTANLNKVECLFFKRYLSGVKCDTGDKIAKTEASIR